VQLQANEYFDHLSLRELLRLFTALYGRAEAPETLLGRVNLLEKANAKPAKLSGGQKQRFSIACALVNDRRCCSSTNRPPLDRKPSATSGT
jgi:ABC-2 type transport system ATP-binding protein